MTAGLGAGGRAAGELGPQIVVSVAGMHCASCGLLIDDVVEDLAGVARSATDVTAGRTVVTLAEGVGGRAKGGGRGHRRARLSRPPRRLTGHRQVPEPGEELHPMMCWNKKTLGIVAVGALAVLAFAPSAFGRALPFLLMAACPLGMLFMARGAAGACRRQDQPPGGREAASPDAAQAEIARLRQEVERLRAAEATGDPAAAGREPGKFRGKGITPPQVG